MWNVCKGLLFSLIFSLLCVDSFSMDESFNLLKNTEYNKSEKNARENQDIMVDEYKEMMNNFLIQNVKKNSLDEEVLNHVENQESLENFGKDHKRTLKFFNMLVDIKKALDERNKEIKQTKLKNIQKSIIDKKENNIVNKDHTIDKNLSIINIVNGRMDNFIDGDETLKTLKEVHRKKQIKNAALKYIVKTEGQLNGGQKGPQGHNKIKEIDNTDESNKKGEGSTDENLKEINTGKKDENKNTEIDPNLINNVPEKPLVDDVDNKIFKDLKRLNATKADLKLAFDEIKKDGEQDSDRLRNANIIKVFYPNENDFEKNGDLQTQLETCTNLLNQKREGLSKSVSNLIEKTQTNLNKAKAAGDDVGQLENLFKLAEKAKTVADSKNEKDHAFVKEITNAVNGIILTQLESQKVDGIDGIETMAQNGVLLNKNLQPIITKEQAEEQKKQRREKELELNMYKTQLINGYTKFNQNDNDNDEENAEKSFNKFENNIVLFDSYLKHNYDHLNHNYDQERGKEKKKVKDNDICCLDLNGNQSYIANSICSIHKMIKETSKELKLNDENVKNLSGELLSIYGCLQDDDKIDEEKKETAMSVLNKIKTEVVNPKKWLCEKVGAGPQSTTLWGIENKEREFVGKDISRLEEKINNLEKFINDKKRTFNKKTKIAKVTDKFSFDRYENDEFSKKQYLIFNEEKDRIEMETDFVNKNFTLKNIKRDEVGEDGKVIYSCTEVNNENMKEKEIGEEGESKKQNIKNGITKYIYIEEEKIEENKENKIVLDGKIDDKTDENDVKSLMSVIKNKRYKDMKKRTIEKIKSAKESKEKNKKKEDGVNKELNNLENSGDIKNISEDEKIKLAKGSKEANKKEDADKKFNDLENSAETNNIINEDKNEDKIENTQENAEVFIKSEFKLQEIEIIKKAYEDTTGKVMKDNVTLRHNHPEFFKSREDNTEGIDNDEEQNNIHNAEVYLRKLKKERSTLSYLMLIKGGLGRLALSILASSINSIMQFERKDVVGPYSSFYTLSFGKISQPSFLRKNIYIDVSISLWSFLILSSVDYVITRKYKDYNKQENISGLLFTLKSVLNAFNINVNLFIKKDFYISFNIMSIFDMFLSFYWIKKTEVKTELDSTIKEVNREFNSLIEKDNKERKIYKFCEKINNFVLEPHLFLFEQLKQNQIAQKEKDEKEKENNIE